MFGDLPVGRPIIMPINASELHANTPSHPVDQQSTALVWRGVRREVAEEAGVQVEVERFNTRFGCLPVRKVIHTDEIDVRDCL